MTIEIPADYTNQSSDKRATALSNILKNHEIETLSLLQQSEYSATSTPLTTAEIEKQLKNPHSILAKTYGQFITKTNNDELILKNNHTLQLLAQLQKEQQFYLDIIHMRTTSSIFDMPEDQQEDLLLAKKLAQQQQQKLQELQNKLEQEMKALEELYEERTKYINSIPNQWQNQRKAQVTQTIVPQLNKVLQANGHANLSQQNIDLLANAPKLPHVALTHPHLLPSNLSDTQLQTFGNLLDQIRMLRAINQTVHGDDDSLLGILQNRSLFSSVDKISVEIFQTTNKEDTDLFTQQTTTLQNFNKHIAHSQDNIQRIQQEIMPYQPKAHQTNTNNISTKIPTLKPTELVLLASDGDVAPLLRELELWGRQQEIQLQKQQHTLPTWMLINFKMVALVKKIKEEEKPIFWQNIMRHAKNLEQEDPHWIHNPHYQPLFNLINVCGDHFNFNQEEKASPHYKTPTLGRNS